VTIPLKTWSRIYLTFILSTLSNGYGNNINFALDTVAYTMSSQVYIAAGSATCTNTDVVRIGGGFNGAISDLEILNPGTSYWIGRILIEIIQILIYLASICDSTCLLGDGISDPSVCSKITCDTSCQSCVDPTVTGCTVCAAGRYFYQYQCITTCPAKYYGDTIYNYCACKRTTLY
jgi:hypothetical protein